MMMVVMLAVVVQVVVLIDRWWAWCWWWQWLGWALWWPMRKKVVVMKAVAITLLHKHQWPNTTQHNTYNQNNNTQHQQEQTQHQQHGHRQKLNWVHVSGRLYRRVPFGALKFLAAPMNSSTAKEDAPPEYLSSTSWVITWSFFVFKSCCPKTARTCLQLTLCMACLLKSKKTQHWITNCKQQQRMQAHQEEGNNEIKACNKSE